MTPNPKHIEVAAAMQRAFKEALPPGFLVCAIVVDTVSTEGPPYEMFVTRSIPLDVAREIAGAFCDGKPSIHARIVELEAANDGKG